MHRDCEIATTNSAMATLKMDAIVSHQSSLNSEPVLKPVQVTLSIHDGSTNSWNMFNKRLEYVTKSISKYFVS